MRAGACNGAAAAGRAPCCCCRCPRLVHGFRCHLHTQGAACSPARPYALPATMQDAGAVSAKPGRSTAWPGSQQCPPATPPPPHLPPKCCAPLPLEPLLTNLGGGLHDGNNGHRADEEEPVHLGDVDLAHRLFGRELDCEARHAVLRRNGARDGRGRVRAWRSAQLAAAPPRGRTMVIACWTIVNAPEMSAWEAMMADRVATTSIGLRGEGG